MSVFSPSDAPCGVFAPQGGTLRTLEFFRQTPSQNSAGDTYLSFTSIGTFTLDMQPLPSKILRQVGGMVVEIATMGLGMGFVPLQARDRTYLDGAQVEVVQPTHYGQEHTEISFKDVAR